jgi:hypothetical protein
MNKLRFNVLDENEKILETITRVPIYKSIGNFNPTWIRYHGKMYYVYGGIDYAYMHGNNPLGIEYYIKRGEGK